MEKQERTRDQQAKIVGHSIIGVFIVSVVSLISWLTTGKIQGAVAIVAIVYLVYIVKLSRDTGNKPN